ncbi:NAD-dependent epimerase/dehydratase family protein [Vallicoccus soli]|uniref:NAD(P)-dependent oxidoreductase n=1 Tax=Vallicoccus soli TaxID=2339232 RepID=A0A3A3Z433_9ACTN|nr:NAD(P)-dependent oxidoreductase [Vallicoccus soli]RJK95307.1 NAD(P)-dependent oxidoreductase [Vallicoccus soli]
MTRTVLLTGSAGSIGSELRRGLPGYGWRVRGLDLARPEPLGEGEEALVGDVLDAGLLARAVDGVDAVAHLASFPDEAPLDAVLDSHVRSTGAVLEAARAAGVRRVVLASSNHAVGRTPRPDQGPLGVDVRPRPDTFYGVGKVAMEALGSLYADRYGLEVVALRIGSFLERPTSERHLATWLSPGDGVRLVRAALEAPGVSYAVCWGVSANTRSWWDPAPGRALGYEPEDDAEAYAQEVALGGDVLDLVGGPFTTAHYDAPYDGRQR